MDKTKSCQLIAMKDDGDQRNLSRKQNGIKKADLKLISFSPGSFFWGITGKVTLRIVVEKKTEYIFGKLKKNSFRIIRVTSGLSPNLQKGIHINFTRLVPFQVTRSDGHKVVFSVRPVLQDHFQPPRSVLIRWSESSATA